MFVSINPYNQQEIASYQADSDDVVESKISVLHQAFMEWRMTSYKVRAKRLKRLASQLADQAEALAPLLTTEMGKPLREAEAEIQKCAWVCRYYAE